MDRGTFTTYPSLAGLPPLVRVQRRLEAKIVPLAPLLEDEKACRKAIDALLVTAGLQKGESVSCNGYDVTHVERVGPSSLNQEWIVARLVALQIDVAVAWKILADSTETADDAKWATVKPSKGAAVRAPKDPSFRPRKRSS
jgi:hypothetical protein